MTRTRKAVAVSALLAAAAMALTACSSGGITTSDDLVNAYTAAGGTCDDRSDQVVDEVGTLSDCDGAKLVLIAGANQLEEFDGGWVVGDGWVAQVSDEIGKAMGGTPSMCVRGSGCTPVSGS